MDSHLFDAIARAHQPFNCVLVFQSDWLEKEMWMGEVVDVEIVNTCNALDFHSFVV